MRRFQPAKPKIDARRLNLNALDCSQLIYLIEIAKIEMERRDRMASSQMESTALRQTGRLEKASKARPSQYAESTPASRSQAWRQAEEALFRKRA